MSPAAAGASSATSIGASTSFLTSSFFVSPQLIKAREKIANTKSIFFIIQNFVVKLCLQIYHKIAKSMHEQEYIYTN
jgi:hypothetical protein